MGTTLYVAVDPPLEGVEINHDRVFLGDLIGEVESMDTICEKLGVRSLTWFLSYDPAGAAAFIDDPEELAAVLANAKPIEWFDPGEALPAVRALQRFYLQETVVQQRGRRKREAGKTVWEPVDRTEGVLRDLRDLEAVLVASQRARARFRIYTGS